MVITADNLKTACQELGLPDDAHTLRRAARAFDLYFSGKVEHIENHSFRVGSQRTEGLVYHVQLKETSYLPAGAYAWCTCQDWRNYSGNQEWLDVLFFCKHSIASLLWLRRNGVAEEFDWQKAKSACVELVGEANVGIIIYDLTQAGHVHDASNSHQCSRRPILTSDPALLTNAETAYGRLRQDSPSHYDRLEWFLIHLACQHEARETAI